MRKLRFAVRVDSKTLERELTWDEMQELKDSVKKFCSWDSSSKEWWRDPEI